MTTCKEIIVDRGKKIYVFDDVFELEWKTKAFVFFKESLFSIGWADQPDPHYAQHMYLHSRYSQEDILKLGILDQIADEKMLSILNGKSLDPNRGAIVNLSTPTDTHFAHSHKNTTFLYYANLTWKEEWAGETLFFNEEVSEIVYTSIYKPGRVIIFDGSIPHSLRTQSKLAPQYRFTFGLFFDSGIGLN